MSKLFLPLGLLAALGTSACTNPYSEGQRAAGGALIGAGSGAALGAIFGGGQGAAIGAITGGAVGAATGVITTPQRPRGY
ncbi:YMGG-like glycine zipper-containing protein [Roseococcus sp. YIM B11640]|uniref:YMGG-like glycine zipper-containing protein n=1 Tax=Roseococcus sp. YIM B11640 TaxID=3133973 RepID=UPI003C79B55B